PTYSLFLFSHPPTTSHINTLSLHDALPISPQATGGPASGPAGRRSPGRLGAAAAARALLQARGRETGRPRPRSRGAEATAGRAPDRKSTRLNSSHVSISYAVFCLKKKINYI